MKSPRGFGPGFLVAAAFIGPGTVTTASMAGATFSYALVWVMLFAIAATIILQEMAAQLEPLLGPAAKGLFALGLVAEGLTSAVTAPAKETLRVRWERRLDRAQKRHLAAVTALGEFRAMLSKSEETGPREAQAGGGHFKTDRGVID